MIMTHEKLTSICYFEAVNQCELSYRVFLLARISKISNKFCRTIESNSQMTFSLLFFIPTWPPLRHVKTLHYVVFLWSCVWVNLGPTLKSIGGLHIIFASKERNVTVIINQRKSPSVISCDHQQRDRIQESCPSPNQAVGLQVNDQSLLHFYRLSAKSHEHFCKKELLEKKLPLMSLS